MKNVTKADHSSPRLLILIFFLLIPTLLFSQAQRRNEIVQVVAKTGPGVVNISTDQKIENIFANNPMQNLLRDFFHQGSEGEYVQNSLGSGVIIDSRGYILTNEHVILGASKIRISLADKREYFADVVGSDSSSDLAVLKINSKTSLPTVKLGTSSDIMIGETIIAIGNPLFS